MNAKLTLLTVVLAVSVSSTALSAGSGKSYGYPGRDSVYTFQIYTGEVDRWDSATQDSPPLSPSKASLAATKFIHTVPLRDDMKEWQLRSITLWQMSAAPEGTTNLITTADVPAEELAVQCPVVVYARAQTNNPPRLRFFVAEVWKGAAEASRAGITNGIELPVNWPSNGGPLPEGAVVFYQRHGSGALQVRSEWMVRHGHVGGMDTNKFKTKCTSPAIQSGLK